MVTDGDGEVRGRAVDVILTARGQPHHPLRRFSVPQLNWEADAYPEMINWEGPMTEPPVTRDMPDAAIEGARDRPLDLPKFPCHSQSVERCVKLVSDVSRSVYGQERRQ